MTPTLSIKKIQKNCEQVCTILKALSHPSRLLILGHLLEGPKSVGDLVVLCETPQSQMSQFLIRLKHEGLVKAEKDGKYQVYSLSDKRLLHLMKTIQAEYCND
jgi:ArsR family transcriptional regulator